MAQNESPKPSATTQQKESQGKEKLNNIKGQKDGGSLGFKETITVQKVN